MSSSSESKVVSPKSSSTTTLEAPTLGTPPNPPSPSQLQHAPSVPAGWTKLTRTDTSHLRHLTATQATESGALSAELGSSTTYVADFGPHAPGQAGLVALLSGVAALNTESTRATSWAEYVGDMRMEQADAAVGAMDQLALVWAPALNVNPELAQKYPLVAAFLAAPKQSAARAAAARKASKKAKADSASAAKAVGETSTAAATPLVVAKPSGS